MKKLSLIIAMLFITFNISNADDCIMAKELKVKFLNNSTIFADEEAENAKIEEFKDFVKQTDLYVLIEGHTNKLSNAKHNYNLSTRRAVKVMQILKAKGVAKDHVRAMGFGESTPLYDNNTKEGLAKNRRVIAEVFNTKEELNQYIQDSKNRIQDIKFKEQ